MGRHKRALTNQILGGLLVAVMLACAGVIGNQAFRFPTLLITNESMDPVRVYSEMGILANVYPGQEKCVKLRELGNIELRFRQISGSVMAPSINADDSPGWKVTIRNLLRVDVYSLMPAEVCK